MHLALNLFIIFAVWKWADYKNWQKYHATMLFLSFINLVYAVISFHAGAFLWQTKEDFPLNHVVSELAYTMILLPCTVLLFLSNYPKNPVKVVIHFLKYIFIYSAVEAVMVKTGRMVYDHSWNILYSVIFYFLMFPAIIIHYRRPILAYIIFVLITIFGVWAFKLPVY